MSRMVRCTCRSHCRVFNPETQSFEGEGEMVIKSTAANHRQDDLLSQTLATFSQDIATRVLSYSPPPEFLDHHRTNRGVHDQPAAPPGFHGQSSLDDYYFVVEAEIAYRCTWAPINFPLVFSTAPPHTLPYRRPSAPDTLTPNREPYALDPQDPTNKPYLENESRLYEILVALKRRPISNVRDRLLARTCEGLVSMEHHKEREWNRQRAGSIVRHHGYSVVDTGARTLQVLSISLSSANNKDLISKTRSLTIQSSPPPS